MAVLQRILSFYLGHFTGSWKTAVFDGKVSNEFVPAGITVGFGNLPCGEQHIRKGIYCKCIGSGTDRIQCHA